MIPLSFPAARALDVCLAATGPAAGQAADRSAAVLAEPDILLEFPALLPAWIPVIFGALLVIFVLVRVRLRKQAQPPVRPAALPHVDALQALAALESVVPGEASEEEPFHTLLSRVLRQYLADRYRLAALEMVNEEAVAALEEMNVGSEQPRRLGLLLERCDRVRFGRRSAGPDAAREALGQARRFVVETAGSAASPGGGS